ncbi:MAG: hypothetical protein HYS08_08885 [Chlamydiae bacterium]|nr:hypothetical protein [Chlamydiota bacterium]MBI3265478.1 hypothetical protein [Chlamydiota bacterium]
MQFLRRFFQGLLAFLLLSSWALAGNTNLSFGRNSAESQMSSPGFGKLSLLIQAFLESSFGDKIDPDSRKRMGDLFESEAIEMRLYRDIVLNELDLFKSREERLKKRYVLCKKVLISLWKKSHQDPRMRKLFNLLRDSRDETKQAF